MIVALPVPHEPDELFSISCGAPLEPRGNARNRRRREVRTLPTEEGGAGSGSASDGEGVQTLSQEAFVSLGFVLVCVGSVVSPRKSTSRPA